MKFYGQFYPPQDQILYETYFSDSKIGTFLECGAADGIIDSSCLFFEESLGWSGINVEAVPFIYKTLMMNRPKSINIFAALSDKAGEGKFVHAIHPIYGQRFNNGSLSHAPEHKQDLIQQGCRFQEYLVPLMTYNELVTQTGIRRLDLFVLDVEGHEISVIDGMRGASVLPRVFCIEFGFLNADVLHSKLADLGFRKDRIVHNNVVYLHNEF